MASSFPTDVFVLEREALVHGRFAPAKGMPALVHAKRHPLPPNSFSPGTVTPMLEDRDALRAVARRVRTEGGRIDRASLLLPDSWFRINLLEIPNLPDRGEEADEMVRFTLRRTLPAPPDEFRIVWQKLDSASGGSRVMALAAHRRAADALEQAFADEGIQIVLLEPVGLNLWNTIAVAENADGAGDRVLIYVRSREFTTAVFRGDLPLFIRARNLGDERSILQEIRLSVLYLRNSLRLDAVTDCYITGAGVDESMASAIASEFGAKARMVELSDHATIRTTPPGGIEPELTACTGVFTA